MRQAQPHSVCPRSCLEQAPRKSGSSLEPTELVYILGGSFRAVCSLPPRLPPSLLPLLLPWGGGMVMAAMKKTGCCCASIALPAMWKPTDEWNGSPETSRPSLRTGGGEAVLRPS